MLPASQRRQRRQQQIIVISKCPQQYYQASARYVKNVYPPHIGTTLQHFYFISQR